MLNTSAVSPRAIVPRAEFETMLVASLPRLRGLARFMCLNRAAADDLVQDTIVRALANRERFAAGSNFPGWLYRVMRNKFISDCRKKKETPDVDGVLTAGLRDRQDAHLRLEARQALEAFDRLPLVYREALLLVGLNGMSYDEAADALGVAPGTIKSRAARGRQVLIQLTDGDTGREVPWWARGLVERVTGEARSAV